MRKVQKGTQSAEDGLSQDNPQSALASVMCGKGRRYYETHDVTAVEEIELREKYGPDADPMKRVSS